MEAPNLPVRVRVCLSSPKMRLGLPVLFEHSMGRFKLSGDGSPQSCRNCPMDSLLPEDSRDWTSELGSALVFTLEALTTLDGFISADRIGKNNRGWDLQNCPGLIQ